MQVALKFCRETKDTSLVPNSLPADACVGVERRAATYPCSFNSSSSPLPQPSSLSPLTLSISLEVRTHPFCPFKATTGLHPFLLHYLLTPHPISDPPIASILIPGCGHLKGVPWTQGLQGSVWNEGKHIQLSRALNILGPFNSHVTRECIPINDQNK